MIGKKTIIDLAPYILAVTDLSEASNEALKWAGKLAHRYKANLKVLYPYRLNHIKVKDDLVLLKENMETQASDKFKTIAKHVFDNGNSQYDFEVEVGFINDRVHSFTTKNDVLFVVIGKQLVYDTKEVLQELLNDLQAPLLVVPPGGQLRN